MAKNDINVSKLKGWKDDTSALNNGNDNHYQKIRSDGKKIHLSISKIYGGDNDEWQVNAHYFDGHAHTRTILNKNVKGKNHAISVAKAFMRSH